MTDAELIELVQSHSPDELTPEEVTALCERVDHSPALRQALAESLEMERYLADVLSRIAISPEQILARCNQSSPRPRVHRLFPRWIVLLLLFLGVSAGGLTWVFMPRPVTPKPSEKEDEQTAQTTAAPPPVEPPPQPTEKPPLPPDPKVEEPPPDDPLAAPETPHDTAPEPYAQVNPREPGLTESELKAWFTPVPGQSSTFKALRGDKNTVGAATEMSGLLRLRNFGKDGTALRCSFRSYEPFKLHFWKGKEGVTLELWKGFQRIPDIPLAWVAYRTTRTDNEPRPATLALTATDEQRYARTWVGRGRLYWFSHDIPVDLRHENGLLIISCGDIRLLTVPCAEPPDEVYFEGKAVIHRMGLTPAIPLRPLPAPAPLAYETEKPADLKWLGNETNLTRRPDGSVELTADNAPQRTWVATRLPPRGICEVIVQLEDVTPNTTIYLGDEQGNILVGATCRRDENSGRIMLFEAEPNDASTSIKFDPLRWPPAFVGGKLWVRMLLTSGQLKCWTSTDGVYWGRAFEPILEHKALPYATVGLSCKSEQPHCSLRLRRLQLREYRALNSLAPAELVQKAPVVPHTTRKNLSDWLAAVQSLQPKDVDALAWERACAVRNLASGAGPTISPPVLEYLVEYGLSQSLSWDAKVRLLDEAVLMLPKCKELTAEQFMHFYHRVGAELRRAGELRPYSRIRQALFEAPIWTQHSFQVFPESLGTAEMLNLVYAGQWKEVESLCRAAKVYLRDLSVFDWGALQASRRESRKPLAKAQWQAPAILETDKDGANDLVELDAAVRNQTYDEACGLLTRRNARGQRGLVPDSSDEQRLVSWPLALKELMQSHPDLRTTLREKFAPEARLQLRRALDENDATALEALAERFPGTEEAAAAHLWLGDRLLLEGEPARAVHQLRQALQMTEGGLRPRIDDRLQLAAALLGQPVAAPPAADIAFGDARLSPATLQELRQQRRTEGMDSRWTALLPPQPAPAPTLQELVSRGHLDGASRHPPRATFYITPLQQRVLGELDWFDRSCAAAATESRLVVSNRSQVDCYEVPSGKLHWRTVVPRPPAREEALQNTFECPLVPMRPVIVAQRIFVRREMPGPIIRFKGAPRSMAALACLDLADGKVLWTTTNYLADKVHYLSDPVVIQDQVFAVAEKFSSDSERALVLLVHEPRTGALLAERPLVRLTNHFNEQRSCQLTALEDGCIATSGGAVFRFDLAGNLCWARRQFWVPADFDSHWLAQTHEPPVVAAGRCYVVQPGVLDLFCLDPDNGRVHWHRALPGLQRIAGLVDGKLVVQTDAGIVCLDATTGKDLWQHEARSLLSAPLCGGPHGLMYSIAETVGESEIRRPCLVWVDLNTGRETARRPLDTLRQRQPRFGPLLVAGKRLWAFSGKGEDLSRDLLELVPKSSVPNSP